MLCDIPFILLVRTALNSTYSLHSTSLSSTKFALTSKLTLVSGNDWAPVVVIVISSSDNSEWLRQLQAPFDIVFRVISSAKSSNASELAPNSFSSINFSPKLFSMLDGTSSLKLKTSLLILSVFSDCQLI